MSRKSTSHRKGDSKKNKCCNRCKDSCNLLIKSTPYKTKVIQIGYKGWRSWDIFKSLALATLLISIAVIFGEVILINDFIHFDTGEVCIESSQKLNNYLNEYKNITNYYELKMIGPLSKNITETLYASANIKYNYKSETKWPTPHQQSEAELLSNAQRDCTGKICWDTWGLSVICKTYSYPCPIQLGTNGVYFGGENSFDTSSQTNYSSINRTQISSEMNEYLFEIYERMNYVSSFYVVYMAAMIFIGAPYIITSRKITSRIRFALSSLTKPWFIIMVLILWYSVELLNFMWYILTIQTDILLLLRLGTIDVCFIDAEFVAALYSNASVICSDITYSRSLYDASISNLGYYKSVEETYKFYYYANQDYINNNIDQDIRYMDDDILFADDAEYLLMNQYNLMWNEQNVTDCSPTTMLDYIGPSDSSFNVWSIILFSGFISGLLLQPILANFIKSIFIMIDPLSVYCGRVEVPYHHGNTQNEDINVINQNEIRKIINKFERQKNFCPLILWFILLLLIILNIIGINNYQ